MNGYMNAEILGKNRGIKFGMMAVQQIMQAMESGSGEVTMLYEMLYWELRNNCYVKNETPDFTKEEVCDWVDANITNVKFFEELGECFKTSTVIQNQIDSQKKSNLTSKKKKDGIS